jgi:DNA polymerase III delta prime subunit
VQVVLVGGSSRFRRCFKYKLSRPKNCSKKSFWLFESSDTSGIIVGGDIPKFVAPCGHPALPNDMELAHHPNHLAFDASKERKIDLVDVIKMFLG